jgi:hypothetical protein
LGCKIAFLKPVELYWNIYLEKEGKSHQPNVVELAMHICDFFHFDIIFRMFSKHDNFSGIVTKQDMTNTTLLTLGGAINVKKWIEQNVHTTKIENIDILDDYFIL